MSKEANTSLADSLSTLNERLRELKRDEFQEFRPIGDAINAIEANGHSEPNFIQNLIQISSAVIRVRKQPGSTLNDLPLLSYHLWLPFKAAGATLITGDTLAEAVTILKDGTSKMSSHWNQILGFWEPGSEPRAQDRELSQLRDRLLTQFEYCNEWYSANVEKKKRFFSPSEGAFNELFFRTIPVAVSSPGEFSIFILLLYKVFDEGLPKEIRQWKDHKESLSPPLLKIASEVLNSDSYKQFELLRNKFAVHDQEELAWTMGPVFHKLIGVRTIARDDAASFMALQKSVLKMLLQVLDEVRAVLSSSQNVRRAT